MEIATANFKKYLIDAYRELPEDICIIDDGDYHILKNDKNQSYIMYIYDGMYKEYSYVPLGDIEWNTILAPEVDHDNEDA